VFDISKVELEDFKSFKGKHTFEFPTKTGLYGITGKNLEYPRLGANDCGKTTLLEAIFWCLYGHTTRGLKAGDVINWDAKSCAVTVDALIGNADVTVTRTQSPNSLRLNGHPVDQEILQKTLRIGPQAFMYAVMIPQFGDAFFDLSAGDKLTLFSQIMELDYWLDKSEEAAKLAKELLEAKSTAEREIARHKGQLETIDGDIEALKAKNKTFGDAEAQRIKRLRQELQEAGVKAIDAGEAMEFTKKALKNLTVKLETVERGAKKCPTCGQPVANKELNALLTNQADFERQLRKLERDKDAAQGEIQTIKASMAPRENPYAEQITQKKNAKETAKAKIKTLEEETDDLGRDHAAVSWWVTGFKRVRLFIVEETLRQLELEINNSLTALGLVDWHIELDVERENKSGGITKGFTVLVHAPGAPGPVKWEAFGGGATQRLRLAGDLGLANLIMERAGLRSTVEFFDEPSRHLSQEGMFDLAETLNQRALDQGKRTFLIEHNLLDYSYRGVITIVKDGNGSHIEPN
jgi:DNA repair exonuclease SbcCD ATPase subunit